MKQIKFLLILLICSPNILKAQDASIRVENMLMKTYPFSDPDPVPEPGRIYPYFRFEGYTNNSIQKEWKMVILENDYIKVFVCPDIGGKVWGAIEKSTGREFLYYNHVVKFRDVAMRGPWTSGGLEYNFGDIGHIPTCATPVDYTLKENDDGSVSCTVGAIDLPSRTKWNVEILLQKDKAYFETKASWFNLTPVPTTYYHWMNAAVKASGKLHFIYPGDHYIGHGGEYGTWPQENKRDLSFYENNDFGPYKSYHVLNSYTNFFGGYWEDDDFGFGHLASYDDKPGKKLWIWGLSRQGMIWEDLLTDSDGQYIEFQAGKLFNQAAGSSTFTPFKHREFQAYDADIMNEIWFPLVKTGGMVAASEFAVLNVEEDGKKLKIIISALQKLDEEIIVSSGDNLILKERIVLKPLQNTRLEFEIDIGNDYLLELGDSKLYYNSDVNERKVERPLEHNKDFNWNSAYGLYTRGLEFEKQRHYSEALAYYDRCLNVEKAFVPAINRKALMLYRMMEYKKAKNTVMNSLAVDTYDAEANYIFGLSAHKLGENANAKSGFSIAAASVKYRSASYTLLAGVFVEEKNYPEAFYYARKAISYNEYNARAYMLIAIIARKTGNKMLADEALGQLSELDPTLHFTYFEKYLLYEINKENFQKSVNGELPVESYLELAIFYYNNGCEKEAREILNIAPENPLVYLWLAKLDEENRTSHLEKAIEMPVLFVFPFREETTTLLEAASGLNDSWKLKYYLALIYWNKGLVNQARSLFAECGSIPDAAVFYMAKAKLFSNDQAIVLESINRAVELNKNDWRVALTKINYLLANNMAEEAVLPARQFSKKYPENPVLGLRYARALIMTGSYRKSIEFLEGFNILPFEGGAEGRSLYYKACIKECLELLSDKNYMTVIVYADKAREWPEKLGAGKPYNVDERMADYLLALALNKSGRKDEAKTQYKKTAGYEKPADVNDGSALIFQLLAMKHLGMEAEAGIMLKNVMNEYPGNLYLKWVFSVFTQDGRQDEIKNNISAEQIKTGPGNIIYSDGEFELVADIISSISKNND